MRGLVSNDRLHFFRTFVGYDMAGRIVFGIQKISRMRQNNAHTFVNEWDKPKGKVLCLLKLKKSFNYSMHNDLLLKMKVCYYRAIL